jgi:trehalose-6-phosphatase
MTFQHKLAFNLVFTVFVVSAARVVVEQLDLRFEPKMGDLEKYLEEYVSEKPFALLLDYDGTLAAIQPHPNLTYMTDFTKEALLNISSSPNVFVSVISGRGVDDVKKKVGIEDIVYAGNHGLEILYPNGSR